ncbi:MAG: hypothetical protein H6682_09610 [Candidatus Eisenbacteria bacterium]|nr:hypothetical protein [Candidatus Eisenbacteria bacterium]
MKRVGIGILVLAGLLLLVPLVVPRLISSDALRARLETALSARLGRSVEIGEVTFGLRPLPQVHAENIRLGRDRSVNEEGTSATETEISANSLDLAVALRPLFRKEVEVVRATADGLVVDVWLEALAAGQRGGGPAHGSGEGRGDGSGDGQTDGPSGGDGKHSSDGSGDGAGSGKGANSRPGDGAGAARSPGREGGPNVSVRVESLVLSDLQLRVHKDGSPLFSMDHVREELEADIAVDGVVHLTGKTEAPAWRLDTPTGSFGDGLPAVLEKSLRFDPNSGDLRIESAELDLGGLPVEVSGTVGGLQTGAQSDEIVPVLDLTFSGGPGRIENIVGLLPSAWVSRTEGLRSSGSLRVTGSVTGPLRPGDVPEFSLSLDLSDGHLEGGALPTAIDQLLAKLSVDPRSVAIERLSARAAGSSIEARGTVENYQTLPKVDLALDGDLDLALLSALAPHDPKSGELSGRADVQLVVRGTIVEGKDPAETLDPIGTVALENVAVRGIEQPVEAMNGTAAVRGRELEVSALSFRMGDSDIAIDGKVANFWVLDPRSFDRPGTSRADLVVRSERLDLDALAPPAGAGMSTSGSGAGASSGSAGSKSGANSGTGSNSGSSSAATGTPSGFEVFAGFLSRLEGPIRLQIGTARVREMDWTHVDGRGALDAGRIRIDGMDLEAFGGKLAAIGSVDIRNPKNPAFDLGVQATALEASRFFTDNPGLSKLSGLGGFVQGTVDLAAQTKGSLDETFQLDLRTLTSLGNLEMEGGKITGHPIQTALAGYLGQSDLRTLPIHDWLQPFKVRDGRVEFEKVLIKAGDFTLSGSGWSSIAGDVRLDADLLVPANRTAQLRSKLPAAVADVLLGKPGEPVLLPITVSGPAAKPSVQVDDGRLTDRARARAQEQLDAEKKKLEQQLEAEKEALQKKLEDEAKKRAKDTLDDLLPGPKTDSSGASQPDSLAGKLEEEVKGVLKGIFKRK